MLEKRLGTVVGVTCNFYYSHIGSQETPKVNLATEFEGMVPANNRS